MFYETEPRQDELYHFKYIRKYKNKKGKWVYVHPYSTGNKVKDFVDTKVTGKAYDAPIKKLQEESAYNHSYTKNFIDKAAKEPSSIRNGTEYGASRLATSFARSFSKKAVQNNSEISKLKGLKEKTVSGKIKKSVNKGKSAVSKLLKR